MSQENESEDILKLLEGEQYYSGEIDDIYPSSNINYVAKIIDGAVVQTEITMNIGDFGSTCVMSIDYSGSTVVQKIVIDNDRKFNLKNNHFDAVIKEVEDDIDNIIDEAISFQREKENEIDEDSHFTFCKNREFLFKNLPPSIHSFVDLYIHNYCECDSLNESHEKMENFVECFADWFNGLKNAVNNDSTIDFLEDEMFFENNEENSKDEDDDAKYEWDFSIMDKNGLLWSRHRYMLPYIVAKTSEEAAKVSQDHLKNNIDSAEDLIPISFRKIRKVKVT